MTPTGDGEWPDEVTVGHIVYRLRQYTPKRKGEAAGHGWLRTMQFADRSHTSEANNEVTALVDEIVRLRWSLARYRDSRETR